MSNMVLMHLKAAGLFGAVLGFIALAPSARADGNRLLPFWAQPYPTNYVYDRPPPPPNECIVWQTVDTFFGPRRQRVYVCDGLVTSRY